MDRTRKHSGLGMQAFTPNPCQRTAGSFEIVAELGTWKRMGGWQSSHCIAAHSSWGKKQTDTQKRNQGDANQPLLPGVLQRKCLMGSTIETLCPPYLTVRAGTQGEQAAHFLHLDTLQVKGDTPINYVGTSGVVRIPGQMATRPRPCPTDPAQLKIRNRNKPIWIHRKDRK